MALATSWCCLWPARPWSDRCVGQRFCGGGGGNSPVLQRVLCIFGGDLSRHWVPKRRRPVIVAVDRERMQKKCQVCHNHFIANPRAVTFLYRFKTDLGMTISSPAEREGVA